MAKKKESLMTAVSEEIKSSFNLDKFLANISKNLSSTPCIISGQIIQNCKKKILKPVIFKRNITEVMDFISNL